MNDDNICESNFNGGVLHGNHAKIEKPRHIEPLFCTNTITANKTQVTNTVPAPLPENAAFSKKCVDENHK